MTKKKWHALTVPVNSAIEALYVVCSNIGGVGSIVTVTIVESLRGGLPSSYKTTTTTTTTKMTTTKWRCNKHWVLCSGHDGAFLPLLWLSTDNQCPHQCFQRWSNSLYIGESWKTAGMLLGLAALANRSESHCHQGLHPLPKHYQL